jgi:NhaP-type Na+/H+ or K+/H+ antiporter
VGSLYYLAYATGSAEFGRVDELWATVGFTVVLSVVVHGVAATPVMGWLDRVREGGREVAPTA